MTGSRRQTLRRALVGLATAAASAVALLAVGQGAAGTLVSMLFDAVVGIAVGIVVVLAVTLVSRLRKPKGARAA